MDTDQTGPSEQHGPNPAQNRRGKEYCGYTEAELLERHPQLRTMPPLKRLKQMIRYAWSDWEFELFVNNFGKPADEATRD